ncbi:hypothetical protein D9758_014471 [Tetrapyrgos nigripes]|uniref:Pali-domain-containing protein n=1 Tax=Tetrapyrgos nigripes TaxID=182062 RepID=A0A8H5FGV6_9AGAR|nr:hypothetical protein D9758_014471 [Tetrapyrgos nigripes]
MSRKFFVPGIIFLFVAFVLSFLTSISLPTIHFLDIVRIHFGGGQGVPDEAKKLFAQETRFGIWGICEYDLNDDSTCVHTGHGYDFPLVGVDLSSGSPQIIQANIGAGWTRGLAVHPVATAVTFIALCLSFSSNVAVLLGAMIASFLAAFLTFLAFIIDIVLYARVHSKAHDVDSRWDIDTAPGFWLTFVSLLCTLFATCTVFIGRRNAADSSPSYPMLSKPSGFFSRFRRN